MATARPGAFVPANGMEDTALGDEAFDELTPEMRPQEHPTETAGIGHSRPWSMAATSPHNMPQAIRAADAGKRWATYVPLTLAANRRAASIFSGDHGSPG